MQKTSKIVIVDDHPVMRMGLSTLISATNDLEVVGEAGSSREAVELIDSINTVDLAILDMSLPDRNGLELIKDLKVMKPDLRCLFISSHDESVYAERVLKAGGRGYVLKSKAPDSLVSAIRLVLKGGVFLSQEMTAKMMALIAGGKSSSEVDALSDRELEVYRAIGEGKTSREIAAILGISIRTVNAHRTHIKDKMDFHDAAELNYHAIRWVESQC